MNYHTSKNLNSSHSRHNVRSDSTKNRDLSPGDVYWVKNMRFENNDGSKDRPVIIVRAAGDTVQYLVCTTQTSPDRYPIMDTISAGLDKDSYVSSAKATMSKDRLSRKLGHLSDEDMFNLGL